MLQRCWQSCRPEVPWMIDITPAQQSLILDLLHQRLPHISALAFGSRVAGWPYGRGPKPYSDLDIALYGLSPGDGTDLAHLRADLEESALPWRVDLSDACDLPASLLELVEGFGTQLQTGPIAYLAPSSPETRLPAPEKNAAAPNTTA
jgi:hypothetical protein